MAEDEVSLARADISQLRQIVVDRLHGLSSNGPRIDPRYGEEPFEWLADQFFHADDELRNWLTAILGELIDELPNPVRWPVESRNNLLALVQKCGIALADRILSALQARKMLVAIDDYHLDCHAGLLKCLIAHGLVETRRFWLEQLDILGAHYGALIFSGLVMHGLNSAVNSLPRLCITEESIAWIRLAIPSLVNRFGWAAVNGAFHRVASELPVGANDEFQTEINLLHYEISDPSREEEVSVSVILEASEMANTSTPEFGGLVTLTVRQREVYAYIRSKSQGQGYGPTLNELAQKFGISDRGVQGHLKVLRNKGLIQRQLGERRNIQLPKSPHNVHYMGLRLIGRIAAGAPIEAVEQSTDLTFHDWLGQVDVFALRVVGDSMIEAHICDGDYAIIRRQDHAWDGQIVAFTDPDGCITLKRVYRERARFRIEPANRSMKPIYRDNITIFGILLGIVRFY